MSFSGLVKITFTLLLLIKQGQVFAGIGDRTSSGGDSCEEQIQIIGKDIDQWILKEGSQYLDLSAGNVTLTEYNFLMRDQIATAKINCTEKVIRVGNAEKSCRNYEDSSGEKWIECNVFRFNALNEENQYRLVHHEYAGLSGFEVNDKEDERSNYIISDQVTAFLETKLVKRLAIKPIDHNLPESGSSVVNEKFSLSCSISGYEKVDYSFKMMNSSATPHAVYDAQEMPVPNHYMSQILGQEYAARMKYFGVETTTVFVNKEVFPSFSGVISHYFQRAVVSQSIPVQKVLELARSEGEFDFEGELDDIVSIRFVLSMNLNPMRAFPSEIPLVAFLKKYRDGTTTATHFPIPTLDDTYENESGMCQIKTTNPRTKGQ